jgi:Family of unknown function (DUF6178)
MPKTNRRARHSRTPAKRVTPEPTGLLDRILDTPHLAHVIPQLQPEVLHRVIETCGLEDCGEIVALATPGQLAHVFDLDLWRAARPGLDEQFDADRFGVWLAVLVDAGAGVAANTLARMNPDFVIAALAQLVRVVDAAAGIRDDDAEVSGEVGGYRIVAKRAGSWDAIVAALIAFDAEHRDAFHRVMRGCRGLSNAGFELDGLDDLLEAPEQMMFNLGADRERRREQRGYATPAQARAFLEMSRRFRHETGAAAPPANPVARGYFRALEDAPPVHTELATGRLLAASDEEVPAEESAHAAAGIVDMLVDAGVLPRPPRALLEGPPDGTTRLALIQSHMRAVQERDHAAFAQRSQELAYLSNTIVAGSAIQSRPFELAEASRAAAAVCNLGLENWPSAPLPDDFLVGQDLVGVFQAGWTVLYERVCMDSAKLLLNILASLRHDDEGLQEGLDELRMALTKAWRAGTPWDAREALDVITILDAPAWATLLGLLDQFPAIHGGIAASQGTRTHAISASAYELISENSQIASVRVFMRSLPHTLGGR